MLRSTRSRAERRGATLVELIVALALLAAGLAGVAATSALSLRQLAAATADTRGASIARARLDSLAALACTPLARAASGSDSAGGLPESWRLLPDGDGWLVVDSVRLPRRRAPFALRARLRCR